MPKVLINPGHGPGNVNKGPTGYYEHEGMWKLSNFLKSELEQRGIQADLTRAEHEYPSIGERGSKAQGYDVYISEHSNAGGGVRGCEVYYSLRRNDREHAQALATAAAKVMGNPNRGAKTKTYPGQIGLDFYGEIRAAAETNCKHIFLCESGFHDNPDDEAWLKVDDNLSLLAKAQAEVIEKMISGTPILGAPQATVEQMQAWAKARGAHQRFIDIAPVYMKYGQLTGIRPEVLYAQAAKETAFGRYGGAVLPEMNNWAGIKTATANGDRTYDHYTFATPDDGVRGHFNHIGAYVGKEPIGEPHPRYYVVKKIAWAGTIKTVEELGEKWAPSSSYGESIVNHYLNSLLTTQPPEHDLRAEIKRLTDALVLAEAQKETTKIMLGYIIEQLKTLI